MVEEMALLLNTCHVVLGTKCNPQHPCKSWCGGMYIIPCLNRQRWEDLLGSLASKPSRIGKH